MMTHNAGARSKGVGSRSGRRRHAGSRNAVAFLTLPLLFGCGSGTADSLIGAERLAASGDAGPATTNVQPYFRCDANDMVVDYNADYPDLAGGPGSAEDALHEWRQTYSIRQGDRPDRSYGGTPEDRSSEAADDHKTFEYDRPDGGRRALVTAELIGDSWHVTHVAGCQSSFLPEKGTS